jgi:DNA-binding NtrC family response regulator
MPKLDDVTLQANNLDPHVDIVSVELTVAEGPGRGQRLQLGPGTARIGSAPGSQLCITDPHVSRMHCEVRIERDHATLLDLGSKNGTWVDGVRIQSAWLAPGSLIRLGSSAVRVEYGRAPLHVAVSTRTRFGGLIGGSLEMRRAYALLERAAAAAATVLLRGETGTGKELAARAIHQSSPRAAGPFVPVDCGSIAATLIESELFGHTRGAFSGAVGDRKGLFEEAHGGTIFLDEIGELPIALQPRLLRALETREVRRIGSNTPRAIDVRVVAATNRSLARAVNEGVFREDLYYRLAVVEIEMPPLRSRREDIPVLADEFNERFAGAGAPIPPEVMSSLLDRSWPGNVRELRNFVERGATIGWLLERPGTGPAAPPEVPAGLEAAIDAEQPLAEARNRFVAVFERAYVQKLLRATGGNVTRAAELAGVNRRTIQRLVARSGDAGDDED